MEEAERLLHENMKLVYFVLRRYFPSLIGDQDLAQEGHIGLWQACLKYDGRDGVKFATFAVGCIRNSILMELRKRRRVPNAVSLDTPLGSEEDSFCLGDTLEDRAASAFETNTLGTDFVHRLNTRDRKLVELRMGGMDQQAISAAIGVPQSLVSGRLKKIRNLYQRVMGG